MCWTCPLTINHLKYKTTRTFCKREPLTDKYRRQKLTVISIFFFINDVSPAMPWRYYTRLFLKPEEPHTSKQRESETKLPWNSRIQFGVPRWPNQRNINRTEKCNPAWATTFITWISGSHSGVLTTGNTLKWLAGSDGPTSLTLQTQNIKFIRNFQKTLNMENLSQNETENQAIKKRANIRNNTENQKGQGKKIS